MLWRRLVGAQIRSQLQYRTSFVLTVVAQFLISFIDFLAILVIFHNVPRLGEWSVQEVAPPPYLLELPCSVQLYRMLEYAPPPPFPCTQPTGIELLVRVQL